MEYINSYLAPCPGYGWSGGAEFKTQIVEMINGRERRNATWSQARHRYSAPFNNISADAYREIKKMHLVCRGRNNAFRFRDVLDSVADGEVFGLGDASEVEFQLSKTSTVDGISYTRGVYAVVAGSFTLYADGVEVVGGYTLDSERGIITFSTAPAAGVVLSWTGVFDVWVRFDEDYLPFTLDNPNATNGVVNLIEVAPPQPGQ